MYLLLLFLNYYIFFFCLKTRRRSLAAAADVADRESIEVRVDKAEGGVDFGRFVVVFFLGGGCFRCLVGCLEGGV